MQAEHILQHDQIIQQDQVMQPGQHILNIYQNMENLMRVHNPRQPECTSLSEENFSPILGWENHANGMVSSNIRHNQQDNQQDLMPKLHAKNIVNKNSKNH